MKNKLFYAIILIIFFAVTMVILTGCEETDKSLASNDTAYKEENMDMSNIISEDKIEFNDNLDKTESNRIEDSTMQIDNGVYYSSNDIDTVKNGDSGKYSYVKKGQYNVYWLIDFDEGYIYNFSEGNGDDETYERIKIESGNLNDGLKLSYVDSSNAWVQFIHFKYLNQPYKLVIVDNDGFEYEYDTTGLKDALKLIQNRTSYEA